MKQRLNPNLIPTFLVLAVLAIAWRWPWASGVVLLLLSGFFLVFWGGGWNRDWMLYLLFIGTPAAMGLMFLANRWLRAELVDESSAMIAAS